MAWAVEIDPGAARGLRRLDPSVARRILGGRVLIVVVRISHRREIYRS